MTKAEHIAETKKLLSDAIDSAGMGIMAMTFTNGGIATRIDAAIDHLIAAIEKEKEIK